MSYQTVIKKLNFIEKASINKDYKKENFVLIGEINRRDILLKIVGKSEKGRVKNLKKEALVDRFISKYNSDLKNLLVNKVTILEVGENDKYMWSIRRYYPGSSLARLRKNKIFLGYDIIRPRFMFKREVVINQIVDNLFALQKLTTDLRKLAVKKDYFKKRFKDKVDQYPIRKIEKDYDIDLKSQLDYFLRHREDFIFRL